MQREQISARGADSLRLPRPLLQHGVPFVLARELPLRFPVLHLCPLHCRARRLASAESGSGLQEHRVAALLCCPPRLLQRVSHFSGVSHLNAAFLADAFLPCVTK